jgi:hypothetical protein
MTKTAITPKPTRLTPDCRLILFSPVEGFHEYAGAFEEFAFPESFLLSLPSISGNGGQKA